MTAVELQLAGIYNNLYMYTYMHIAHVYLPIIIIYNRYIYACTTIYYILYKIYINKSHYYNNVISICNNNIGIIIHQL